MKKYLLRRKAQLEKRLKQLKELLEKGSETRSMEEVQAEVDELTADLDAVNEALAEFDETDDNTENGAGEGEEDDENEDDEEQDGGEGEKRSILTQEQRAGLTNMINQSLSSRVQVKTNEMKTRNAFCRYLVGQISESEARAMGVQTHGGNVLVPESLAKEIIAYAQEENLLRKYGKVVETKGTQGFPILIKKAKANRVKTERALNQPIPETDIEFDEYYLNPTETDALVLVTKKLLAMSEMNVERIVVDELKKAYVREEAEFFFNSADNPGALIRKAVAFTPTATDIYDKFVQLKNSLPTSMLKNARWMINRAALTAIETIKTADGFPLLRQDIGLEGGFGYRLLGFPVDVTDFVDAGTPNIQRLYFGDFSTFYIQDVIGTMEVTKLIEKYADTNHVGFKIWHLNDGQLVYGPFEPSVFKLELNA
ncbi:phage major capsid protein [Anoxybacillus flavithermus]|uniref:phage major capsid protein n=1 Tax=Anoxybacillus flavithermus TaxID=33934 RepID=UPI000B49EF4D|nr:phage major capsid protein [Anoxybacillus flavithermus]ASA96832.1 phage major capsid protein [Anoxybacillus flavithermus]MBE2926705.1 phage major capsid protein [Anoxybacillus flavithermus]MBE2937498.1 phage major capsid protein [Anoxybacillus flavithermus]MBE2945965.1 phage major capsid protein [Anoxybacillus flavithermus]MBE2948769.1 phage major capsid protein [Anoxybacillus flavithermus]